MLALLTLSYVVMIQGLPVALVLLPCIFFPRPLVLGTAAFLGPFLYTIGFVLTAGLLSLPHRRAIVPGRFQRDTASPIYRGRRLYGLCWTSVYYHKPVYFLCLSVPFLKALLFRIFGYRGSLSFTAYPDTWIRDLPLLEIGEGAYLSNRATLGTNMPLRNGMILVDRICIGAGAMIGHLVLLAAGASIDEGAEVGPGAKVGIRSRIGPGAVVGGNVCVAHRATVGARTRVGISAHVGTKAIVGDDMTIPEGSVIAPGTHLEKRDDEPGPGGSREAGARLPAEDLAPRRPILSRRASQCALGLVLAASIAIAGRAYCSVGPAPEAGALPDFGAARSSELTPERVAREVQIAQMPMQYFRLLLDDSGGGSTPSGFERLSEEQIRALRPEQIALLSSPILNRLPTRKLRALRVRYLPDDAFAELSDWTVSRLSAEQIRTLGGKTALLDGESVNSLRRAQLAVLDVPRLTPTAVGGISPARFRRFSPLQIRSMTADQIASLRSEQLRALSPLQLAEVYVAHPSRKSAATKADSPSSESLTRTFTGQR